MNNISSLLLIFHVTIAILIVALILIQKGKGADMGSAFGGALQVQYLVQKAQQIFYHEQLQC